MAMCYALISRHHTPNDVQ